MSSRKPAIVVISRKPTESEQVRLALATRFEIHAARTARGALELIAEHRPLVVTLPLAEAGHVPALREAAGGGCLFLAHGRVGYGDPLRTAPKEKVLAKLKLDDFVGRTLTGDDLARRIWGHMAAAMRAAPRPAGQKAATEAETWGEILTSDANLETFRRLLTKDVVQPHEIKEEDDPTWKELLTARVSGTAFKKLFTKKL